jgi:EmrB/QacA subfamily drug resistance transporter
MANVGTETLGKVARNGVQAGEAEGVRERPAAPNREQPAAPQTHRGVVVASLMLAMFLAAMEVTIVATAMPSIVSRLGGFSEYTWVFSIFLLTQTASIPIYGRLADLYGRRPVFAAGVGLFLVGSMLCGAAGSMLQLIVFRAVQGLGAGAVQPIASTILGDIFNLRERARFQGWLSSVWATSSVVGPLLGGFIIDHLEWHWIFWINLPFGLLAAAGVVVFLREPPTRRRHAVDYAGAVLLMAGIMLLLTLLQSGAAWGWVSPQSLVLLGAAALVLVAFVLREQRVPEPILPLSLFRNRVVAAADVGAVLVGGLTLSLSSFIPLFVQGSLGTSATTAGLTLAAISIGWPLASVIAGRVILVIGFRATALLGGAFCAAGTALLAFSAREPSLVYLGFALAVTGAGMGFMSTTLIVAIQSAVTWGERGLATASNMFSRQLGSSLWVAVLGSALNAVLLSRLASLPGGGRVGDFEGLAVTSLLLNPEARASIDPALLVQLQGSLADAVHAVFVGLLVTGILAVVVGRFLPGGKPESAGERGRAAARG